jgi:uncharacterized Rmd1/YagE family protein
VIHTQLLEGQTPKGDVFFFSYGALVCWGCTEEEEKQVLEGVREFEKEPLGRTELDEFTYAYGDLPKIEEDEIFLHNKSVLTKLAISHGIAQSVKLSTFEDLIQKTIDSSKSIPTELARRGKIPLSRIDISRKMGELFLERSFINLHSDVLDVPEFFWDYPELEPFYRRAAHYLDVSKRAETLNKRLSVVHELFEILSSELHHQHSSRLEKIIILLIFLELSLALLRDLFHLI